MFPVTFVSVVIFVVSVVIEESRTCPMRVFVWALSDALKPV